MRIIYTEDALADLETAHTFILQKWPDVLDMFDRRLGEIERMISEHPESGHKLLQRPSVRSVPFGHYPYVFFYRVSHSHIEVLRIYNTSRRPWRA